MAFLKINNYTVDVAAGSGSDQFVEAGARGYNYANKYYLGRAGKDKRHWSFETTPLASDDASSLIGMLQMRGEHFPFWSDDELAEDATNAHRSQKGLSNVTASPSMRIHGVRAADGALVFDKGGALVSPYVDFTDNTNFPIPGALQTSINATNILSAGNSNPDGSANLDVYTGGTKATETTFKWAGAGCVRWNPGAVGQGLRTTDTASLFSATTQYVVSAYVRPSVVSQVVRVSAREQGGAVEFATSGDVTLPATTTDCWVRVWGVGTTSGAPGPSGYITVTSESSAAAFYVDGLQVEAKADIPTPNPWVVGQTAVGTTVLDYNSAFVQQMTNGFTINGWALNLDSAYTGYNIIANSATDPGLFGLYGNIATGLVIFYVHDGIHASTRNFQTTSTTALGTTWKMCTATFDFLAQTAKIYINGVLEGTDAVNAWERRVDWRDPNINTSAIHMGHRASIASTLTNGLISHVSILPFVASANMISGWYGSGHTTNPLLDDPSEPLSFFPLTCSGDFLASNEKNVLAFSTVEDVSNVSVKISGTWSNYKKIKFSLHEA